MLTRTLVALNVYVTDDELRLLKWLSIEDETTWENEAKMLFYDKLMEQTELHMDEVRKWSAKQ